MKAVAVDSRPVSASFFLGSMALLTVGLLAGCGTSSGGGGGLDSGWARFRSAHGPCHEQQSRDAQHHKSFRSSHVISSAALLWISLVASCSVLS